MRHVITLDDIRSLTGNKKLLDFCAFVIRERGDEAFPDFKTMDLMDIAPLVRHVWAMDFRRGVDDRPAICFSGTHIDDHYEMNITGKCFEEIYTEDDFETAVRGNYYQVYLQEKVSYTRRLAHFNDHRVDKFKTIEAMLFPCSSDGETINYGVGFVEYTTGESPPEKHFALL